MRVRWTGRGYQPPVLCLVACLLAVGACRQPTLSTAPPASSTLRVGYGLSRGVRDINGLGAQINLLLEETLITFSADGRPQPWLADRWSLSDDRRTWRFHVRQGVQFHDGRLLTAPLLAEMLKRRLPDRLGLAFKEVAAIRAVDDDSVEILLERPSNLFLESSDIAVTDPEAGGTAAYRRSGPLELLANEHYWGGRPTIDRIVFEPYDSVRAAWADMLRGSLDMLYQVGSDAYESVAASNAMQIFEFQRRYAYEVVLNVQRRGLQDADVRRRLNAAIDRKSLVAEALAGHGLPEESPLLPHYWANTGDLPGVAYAPLALDRPLKFTCMFVEGGIERLALGVQRQLSSVGAEMALEHVTLDEFNERLASGDFDAFLADVQRGPSLQRAARFWYTNAPANSGHYSSRAVDLAIDAIHDSTDDSGYKRGYAALARALADDPPSIYLAWARSLRAVSTGFDVHVDPARDVMNTVRQWRLAAAPPPAVTH